jgi:hypothetical protein
MPQTIRNSKNWMPGYDVVFGTVSGSSMNAVVRSKKGLGGLFNEENH